MSDSNSAGDAGSKDQDCKDKPDLVATSSMPTVSPPPISTTKIMPWFWAGFVFSVLVSFLLGNDKHTVWLVRQYSIVFGLIVLVAASIFALWKGIRIGRPLPKEYKDSMVGRIILSLTIFICGHAIGFATVALFIHLH